MEKRHIKIATNTTTNDDCHTHKNIIYIFFNHDLSNYMGNKVSKTVIDHDQI